MQLFLFLATVLIASSLVIQKVLARFDHKRPINPCANLQERCCMNQMPIPNSCFGIENICCMNSGFGMHFGIASKIKQLLAMKREKLRALLCSVSQVYSGYCNSAPASVPAPIDNSDEIYKYQNNRDIQLLLQECQELNKVLMEFLHNEKEDVDSQAEVTRYQPIEQKKEIMNNDSIIDLLETDPRGDISLNKRSPRRIIMPNTLVSAPYKGKKYCFIERLEIKDKNVYFGKATCPSSVVDILDNDTVGQ